MLYWFVSATAVLRSKRSENFSFSGIRIPLLVAVLFTLAGHSNISTSASASTGALQGQITDHFGALIPGVIVTVINADIGSVAGEAASDRDGMFIVAGIEPGNYTVKVNALFPFGEAEETVVVEATGVTGLKIALGRGCSRQSDTGGLQEKYLAETVRLALKDAVERLNVPHAKGQPVMLSRANINPDWIAGGQDVEVKLIPEGGVPLADNAGRAGRFLRISEIKTAGGCSSISIGYVTGGNSKQPSDDSGFTLEFRKIGEKWLKRTVLEVIS